MQHPTSDLRTRQFGPRHHVIEYPPGVIPAVYWERVVDPFDYRTEFIALMVIVDGIGLIAVYSLARRTGSWWGVGAWLLLLPNMFRVTTRASWL